VAANSSQKLCVEAANARRARDHRHQQPGLERALAAPGALVAADHVGAERAAGHVAHQRQRRHPRPRRDAQADQAVDRHEGHVVGQEQALAERQQQQAQVHPGPSSAGAGPPQGG
jgi:hypothetical protein